jgi:glycosyltransferase involved in cell wall biosynthesis
MSTTLPRVLIVGPMPPPPGGMANQTRQLARLLQGEGLEVAVVRTNAPYRPAWVGKLRGLRAVFRLVPYLLDLYRACHRADVVHVMANSGLAWHLLAAPAIHVGSARGKPVIVNYRGGLAREFLATRAESVRRTLRRASALAVPSGFLREVFGEHGIEATVVPNVVDTSVFAPAPIEQRNASDAPHIVVTRNLEHLYGNDLAIDALAKVRQVFPRARLTIAGSGPELEPLRRQAAARGLAEAVHFAGRLETQDVVELYRSADVALNPSRADNTPNSVLEAAACGLPVVSTRVGGVPFLVEHGVSAWLVEPESANAIAAGLLQVLQTKDLRDRLVREGRALADRCAWPAVRDQWLALYQRCAVQHG